jgi:uroporphyrinogen-III decarboxylase
MLRNIPNSGSERLREHTSFDSWAKRLRLSIFEQFVVLHVPFLSQLLFRARCSTATLVVCQGSVHCCKTLEPWVLCGFCFPDHPLPHRTGSPHIGCNAMTHDKTTSKTNSRALATHVHMYVCSHKYMNANAATCSQRHVVL